jgi:tripartite-type tricarboxylate transporter receptor subunit TctC
MIFNTHRGFGLVFIGLLLFLRVTPAVASEFPTKPITFICPWPAGGGTDVSMRVLSDVASKVLGQPVIVDNKPGGSGTVGVAAMAATAKPDGYTIGQTSVTVFRYPHMFKVSYDPLKDFTYIIQITGWTLGVVVKNDAPWKTWNDFIAYAKANPGKVIYASPGAGSTLHLLMEKIAQKEGIKWVHVPMKGGAESAVAVLGGHVTATADASSSWTPQVDAGLLRVLVTCGNQRTKKWPHASTLKELGYGIVSNSPWGIAGPKGMDPKIVSILHDAFKKAMESPAFQNLYEKFNIEPFYLNSEDYAKYAQQLYEEEREMVELVGLKKK